VTAGSLAGLAQHMRQMQLSPRAALIDRSAETLAPGLPVLAGSAALQCRDLRSGRAWRANGVVRPQPWRGL